MINLLKKCYTTLMLSVLFFCADDIYGQNNVFPTTGNVGIGTTSPTSKLQVNGGISVTGANPIGGVNSFRNAIQLINPHHAAMIFNPGEESQLMMGFHSNGHIYWGNNNSYTMTLSKTSDLRVFNSLSVGGVLKSGSKMSVDGKISAKEVEVTTSNWPDYVFRPDYDLRPLSEVEAFIKENGHLPEVPNAMDVEANGVLLGEMNKILLKKLEELTLHIIEQKKEIEMLKSLVERVAELEERI